MHRAIRATLRAPFIRAAFALALVALLGGCPPPAQQPGTGPGTSPGGVPGADSPGPRSSVDPYTCGNYALSDFGRRLQAFLQATVALESQVVSTEKALYDTCVVMGGHLGMLPAELQGSTREICEPVVERLRAYLEAGLQAQATLDVNYTPAVCTVDVDAAVRAAAECEAKAEVDIAAYCRGTCQGSCRGSCSGSCQGRCNGTCQGSTGAGGECNGTCDGVCEGSCGGTCEGTCSGGCEGYADVDAEARCEAHAEIIANVEAECTEPELDVRFDASLVGDLAKLEAAVRAIEAGMPRILYIQAKVSGPLWASYEVWAETAVDVVSSGPQVLAAVGEQALCVFGQFRAAAALLASIRVSIDVQVEVSASVQGAVSGGAGGSI